MIKQDLSPDRSFSIVTDGLASKTIYKINRSVFSGMENFYEKDAARLICSLQGLINRDYETNGNVLVYLDLGPTDEFWLEYTRESGKSFSELSIREITSFEEFLDVFDAQIRQCGLILWDENVAATANVAASVCGLEGKLPVKFCDEPDSLYTTLTARGYACKQSLVGLFGENGKAYNDRFKTAIRNRGVVSRPAEVRNVTLIFGLWSNIWTDVLRGILPMYPMEPEVPETIPVNGLATLRWSFPTVFITMIIILPEDASSLILPVLQGKRRSMIRLSR